MKTFTKVYAGLLLIMVVCGATVFLIPVFDPPLGGYAELYAWKLTDKPRDYFVVTNPDPTLLEAISSGKGVIYLFDDN